MKKDLGELTVVYLGKTVIGRHIVGLFLLFITGACHSVKPVSSAEEMYERLCIAALLNMTPTEFETSVRTPKKTGNPFCLPVVMSQIPTENARKILLYFLENRDAFEYVLKRFLHFPYGRSARCFSFLRREIIGIPNVVVDTIQAHKDAVKACLLNIAMRFTELEKASLLIPSETEEAITYLSVAALKADVEEFLPYALYLFCALPQFEASSIFVDIVNRILAHKQEKVISAVKLTIFAAEFKFRNCSDGQVKQSIAFQITRLFAARFSKEIYELTAKEIETIIAEATSSSFSLDNDLSADIVFILQPYSDASKVAPLLLLLYTKCTEYGRMKCLYGLMNASKKIAEKKDIPLSSLSDEDVKETSRVFTWYQEILTNHSDVLDFSFARFLNSSVDERFLKKVLQDMKKD